MAWDVHFYSFQYWNSVELTIITMEGEWEADCVQVSFCITLIYCLVVRNITFFAIDIASSLMISFI